MRKVNRLKRHDSVAGSLAGRPKSLSPSLCVVGSPPGPRPPGPEAPRPGADAAPGVAAAGASAGWRPRAGVRGGGMPGGGCAEGARGCPAPRAFAEPGPTLRRKKGRSKVKAGDAAA